MQLGRSELRTKSRNGSTPTRCPIANNAQPVGVTMDSTPTSASITVETGV